MLLYSLGLTVALVISAPWWLLRMATTERYREGLWQRLGGVPAALRKAVQGKRVVWVHAVSVGEVLAASRLVGELEAALGAGWTAVVSTTTRTGQALARQRFGEARVFYYPLDFGWAVRAYLLALKPAAMVLMESELWPRMLEECSRRAIPVAVVNARVSDRSFARGTKLRVVWGPALRKVTLWLAQSEEDARRLVAMGARADAVTVAGNLKYDVRAPKESRVAELIREAAGRRPIIVAGSTVDSSDDFREESAIIRAWESGPRRVHSALLVLAPRHPDRFGLVESVVCEFVYAKASNVALFGEEHGLKPMEERAHNSVHGREKELGIVLLDTIGDLASVYATADVAFVGGSLVPRGGHNPLEPAQFGVPVVMGPFYENFRDIVETLIIASGISILDSPAGLSTSLRSGRDDNFERVDKLEKELMRLLDHRDAAKAMGERGRRIFEKQQGATARTVAAMVEMIRTGRAS